MEEQLEAEAAARTEALMRRHTLRAAAHRLANARVDIKNLLRGTMLDGSMPEATRSDLLTLVNRIEDSEWRIEQLLLEMNKAGK